MAKRPPDSCAECWAHVDDPNTEAFEMTGDLLCDECWDAQCEADDPSEHSTYHVSNGSVVG